MGADEDREEIHAETEKQEEAFDQIGTALGDLKQMSHVSPILPSQSCHAHSHCTSKPMCSIFDRGPLSRSLPGRHFSPFISICKLCM